MPIMRLLATAMLLGMALTADGQVISAQSSPQALDSYPFVDLSTAEAAHSNEAPQQAENERATRNDKGHLPPLFNEQDPEKSGEIHFSVRKTYSGDFDPLHTGDADLIAIGQITKAGPHLTKSNGYVYSTFTLAVSSVLKGTIQKKSLLLEREGGVVKFPTRGKHFIGVTNWGLPEAGFEYLLFLQRTPSGDSYKILGGYALVGPRVMSLDLEGRNLDSLSTDALVSKVKSAIAAR